MAFTLISLYKSSVCRICGLDSSKGLDIFEENNTEDSILCPAVINKYLPLKVTDDGKLPRKVCPTCSENVVATVTFFDQIIEGQRMLREMWQKELALLRAVRSAIKAEQADNTMDLDENTDSFWKNETFYEENSEISRSMNLVRPRGRPRKALQAPLASPDPPNQIIEEILSSEQDDDVSDTDWETGRRFRRRRRRNRKLPKHFSNSLITCNLDELLEVKLQPTAALPSASGSDDSVIGLKISEDGTKENVFSQSSGTKKKYKCDECSKSFRLYFAYKKHLGSHAAKIDSETSQQSKSANPNSDGNPCQLFQCNLCDFTDPNEERMESHINENHPSSMHEVTQTIKKEDGAQNKNNKADKIDKLQCSECDRRFNHLSSLRYHVATVHEGSAFHCSKCHMVFRHKLTLLKHQMVHSDERPYKCDTCDASFKAKSNLLHHFNKHNVMTLFTCDICSRKFKYRKSLKLHLLGHQGIKPHKCDYCEKAFSQSGNLKEHMRIHTGEKPYKCSHCGRLFRTSSQHKMHTKTHTGVRPYQCQYCHKQFLHKMVWATHERRHTGEKPFTCDKCLRAFPEVWALTKHMRLHTGEKPYKCLECGRCFADCSNLTKHKKIHGLENKHEPMAEFVCVVKSEDKHHAKKSSVLESTVDDSVSLFNEEGLPIYLELPGGRSVHLISVDSENVLSARTNEGWNILLQLPAGHDLADEALLEQIREAVMIAKPEGSSNEDIVVDGSEGSELVVKGAALPDLSNAILLTTEAEPDDLNMQLLLLTQ